MNERISCINATAYLLATNANVVAASHVADGLGHEPQAEHEDERDDHATAAVDQSVGLGRDFRKLGPHGISAANLRPLAVALDHRTL